MKHFDYIITGSGCSGLLLAYRMANDVFFDDKSILIIDRERKVINDRTWCFWEKGVGEWDSLLEKTWNSILFNSDFHKERINISPYQYKMLRSSNFYKLLWHSIDSKENITFLKASVESIFEEKQQVQVTTTEGSFNARKVFNSILFKDTYKRQNKYPSLEQHFVGWFIKTEKPVFDDSSATFMDFTVPQKGNTRFMYFLPTSKNEALVEYTLFSKELLPHAVYEKAIVDYLKLHNITAYTIVEKEQGVIPMSNYPFWKKNTKNILQIGTAGGWAKASTGYTFYKTTKETIRLTDFIKAEKSFQRFYKKSKFWFYDLLLLDILSEKNELGASLFARLFKKNKTDKIFKFLDENTSFLEDLKIMSTMPSGKFLRAILKRVFSV